MDNQFTSERIKYNLISIAMLLFYVLVYPHCEYYPIGIGFFVIALFLQSRLTINVDRSMLWVALFAISYFICENYIHYSTMRGVMYSVSMFILYVAGLNWSRISSKSQSYNVEKDVDCALNIICYGTATYVILCLIYTISTGHILSSLQRNAYIFWNGEIGNSTHFGTIITIALALSAYGIFAQNGKKRFLNLIIFILMVAADFWMSNRIVLLEAPILLLIAIYFCTRNKSLGKKMAVLIAVLLLIVVAYFIWTFNIFGIGDLLDKTSMFQRMNTLSSRNYEDPRLERQIYVLQHFWDHTSGGGYFSDVKGDPHNFWLDVYDYAGIIPFIFIVIVTIRIIYQCIYIFMHCGSFTAKKMIMLVIGFFVAFAYEPVIRSVESITILFFFSAGLLAWYKKQIYSGYLQEETDL